MALKSLIGESSMKELTKKGPVTREALLLHLQGMIFSEKSSFAQCGIFVSAAVRNISSYNKSFTYEQLEKLTADVVLICIADTKEYPFLGGLVEKVS